MNYKIDLFLISGFLGSGKTTLLQKILNNFQGIKVGVLINEFGRIGIDGVLIEKEGLQLVEINNGSIFCNCIKGDFIKALIEFSTKDIELLIIESSGMADPSNVHQTILDINRHVNRLYQYKGAVCIIDSVSFLRQVKVFAPIKNQIASSNFIIINKIDLVNQSFIADIINEIDKLNPEAYVYKTMYSEIPFTLFMNKLFDNGYIGETSNTCYNRPVTYSLEADGSYSEQDIRKFIQRIHSYIMRLKGIMNYQNNWWNVDVVEDQIKVTEVHLSKKIMLEKSKLVFIGYDTYEFKNELISEWRELFMETPVIYEE